MTHDSGRAGRAVRSFGNSVLSLAGALLLIVVIVVGNMADCRSCYRRFSGKKAGARDSSEKRAIVEPDLKNPAHARIVAALSKVYAASGAKAPAVVFIDRSVEINAASFGDGVFLIWEGVSAFPDWAIEGIAAHEVAHDVLRHSTKANELQDVMDVLSEIIITVGGKKDSERDVHDIVSSSALPAYSRAQESDADARGVAILTAAGFSDGRRVMGDTLRLLLKTCGNSGGDFFDSHPSTEDRVRALEAMVPDRR